MYFPKDGDPTTPEATFRRPAWHASVRRECQAIAERVAVLDLPGFSKFEVSGRDARAWLDHLVTGVVPKAGRTALNYLCAPSGGIVTEMTLTNLGSERYWLISAAAGELHESTGSGSSYPALYAM